MVAGFFFATTPHDFIHLFTGHQDTVDHYQPGKTELSKVHIHCQFLQVNLASYLATEKLHSPEVHLPYRELSVPVPAGHPCFLPPTTCLRGPPAII